MKLRFEGVYSKFSFALLFVVLAFSLLGCKEDSSSITDKSGNEMSQAGTEEPMALASDTTKVTIKNKTGYTLYKVFMSPATNSSWGRDLLSTQIYNKKKAAFILTGYSAQYWDIRVDDVSDSYYYYDAYLEPGSAYILTITKSMMGKLLFNFKPAEKEDLKMQEDQKISINSTLEDSTTGDFKNRNK